MTSIFFLRGRPSSSYYFVGYQGDELFYLDPHHSRCIVETKSLGDYTVEVTNGVRQEV